MLQTTTRLLFPFLLFSVVSASLYSQDAGDQLFQADVLHEIRLYFDQEDYLDVLRDNFDTYAYELPVPYIMVRAVIDGEEVDSIGVRYKGFTSYQFPSDKKPLKLDFNEFVPGKRYDGLRKLNLNNGTGDPAMQRDNIAYQLLRDIGAEAPRTSYSRVYFNDEYRGIYQNIEQIDRAFLARNFSNNDGNLFKNKGWSFLEYMGEDPARYQEIFDLKTNEETGDWSGFINFTNVLNNSSDENFPEAIAEVFNVDLFLRVLAVDVATNNWDSYLEHGRNWYLYEDINTGIFQWIPWDYNFSLAGGSFGWPGPDECSVFADFVPVTDGSPTVAFADLSWAPGSVSYSWDFGDGNSSTQEEPTHTYENPGTYEVCLLITENEDCAAEQCKTVDTRRNIGNCNSLQSGASQHTAGPVFAAVLNWAPNCCDIWDEDCENLYQDLDGLLNGGSGSGGGGFESRNFPIDQRENTGTLIRRILTHEPYYDRYLQYSCQLIKDHFTTERYTAFVDANYSLIANSIAEDDFYQFEWSAFEADSGEDGLKGLLSNRIAGLQEELGMIGVCGLTAPIVDPNDVAINEYMASNDSTSSITDQAGDHDDWIELYNNTEDAIDLSDVYLSDKGDNLQKWQFPFGTSIETDGYLVIWADEDGDQPGLHANFKLSKSGESIYLSNADGSIIDSLNFGEQTTNVPEARVPNGTGNFVQQPATLGTNNEGPSSVINLTNTQLLVYPNPTSGFVHLEWKEPQQVDVALTTLTGQVIQQMKINGSYEIVDLHGVNNGFYLLQITDHETGKTFTRKVVKTD